jgi:hypothetical protein
MAERVVLSFREYLRLQINLALGPENRWYAGEKIGHSPTDEEAIKHFAEAGGSENFAEHYVPVEAISPTKPST